MAKATNLAAQAKNVILVALSQQAEPVPAWKIGKLAQTLIDFDCSSDHLGCPYCPMPLIKQSRLLTVALTYFHALSPHGFGIPISQKRKYGMAWSPHPTE